jgi:hypothetical protein
MVDCIGETYGVHQNATGYIHMLFTIHPNDLVLKAWKIYFSSMSSTDMITPPQPQTHPSSSKLFCTLPHTMEFHPHNSATLETSLAPIYQLAIPGNSVLSRRIDALYAFVFDLLDYIHNPATAHLDAGRAIQKRYRSLRPVKKEHVQVLIAGHAEIGPRTHLPCVTGGASP